MSPVTVAQIAARVRAGEDSAVALAQRTLADIEERDAELNAFTVVLRERALADARRVDAQVAAGEDPGALAGVPFAVKDLFDVAGETTRAGSVLSADDPPAPRDAAVLAKLSGAGAVLVGKLNMDEYAYGFVTENAHYGACRNPHDTTRIAGGSSGGAGAAVAAGLVPFALGSDTNGSVRVPAALCGVYGLKPTFGALSRAGMYPLSPTLDHVGLLAGNAADLTTVYSVLEAPASAAEEVAGEVLASMRLALAGGYFASRGCSSALAATRELARAAGAIRELVLPTVELARSAAMIITASEGAAVHREHLRAAPERFDPMTRDRFLAGALLPDSAYSAATSFRAWFCGHLDALLDVLDGLFVPATPFAAPAVGARELLIDGRMEQPLLHLGRYTAPFSFAGLPVLTVPLPVQEGLPLGAQLVGGRGSEPALLALAGALEGAGYVRPSLSIRTLRSRP